MKKVHYKIFIIFITLFVMQSCKKILNTKPADFLTPSQYYQTASQLNIALNGIYDELGSQNLYGQGWWNQINGGTDIEFWRNNTAVPTTTSTRIYNENSSDAWVTGAWNTLYEGINRANSLLDAIDASPVDVPTKSPIKAQAQFLRGYYYFLLVSNWGGVPLRLHATTSVSDANLPRSTIAAVYAQVLSDMTAAEAGLPTMTQWGAGGSGRVSKTTAEGILARVCLTMAGVPLKDVSKYQDAKDWASKVINSGLHTLNPDYRQIFINQTADIYEPKESMWEVEFTFDPTNAHQEFGSVGYANGLKCNDIPYGFASGDAGITRKLYDLGNVIPNDLRRDWNTAPFNLTGTSPNVNKAPIASTSNYNLWVRYPGKWRREFEVVLPKSKTLTGTNFPILRYADVLLMYAEAENELNGPTAAAYGAINKVRERAQGTGFRISGFTVTNGGSGYTSAPAVTISSPTSGNGATASATVSGGKITALALSPTNLGGAFYTTAPTITFTGGTGSGALATAILTAINPSGADLAAGLTKDTFRAALQDERARELCMEGLRRPDLIRWDLLLSSLKALTNDPNISAATNPTFTYAGLSGLNAGTKDMFLPVPVSELTLNKSFGAQNPGF
ncbi:RagB/SusD family nutrient uptake outer membrane protein [Mucilaginibacter sp.]|jgi:hypothetical protein|uniref:RagB/SusD family nutrient uptake outer membrane protein n=1 Tax=Mucilaginibacter sp. TaxID=1882438 RepID=UPI0035620573